MSLSILSRTKILNSVNGLLCFCGRYGGFDSRTNKVVIWNPALRKSVVIRIPIRIPRFGYIVVGFGVCPASDPKLVMIIVDNDSSMWESLGLLEYYDECEMSVCGVWMMKDGANKTFSKIYTVKVEGKSLNGVLAFRNNGEVVMELKDDDNYDESRIEVYKPLSGHTNGVGINGETDCFSVWSYMETLLLLDLESVIYY
ncbi:hypothetical protein Tco_0093323 [Tanacetum coccineum]